MQVMRSWRLTWCDSRLVKVAGIRRRRLALLHQRCFQRLSDQQCRGCNARWLLCMPSAVLVIGCNQLLPILRHSQPGTGMNEPGWYPTRAQPALTRAASSCFTHLVSRKCYYSPTQWDVSTSCGSYLLACFHAPYLCQHSMCWPMVVLLMC